MQFEFKKISWDYIGGALEKAEKYRFMNHPKTSESICRDILNIDPDNQKALILLILALNDQFDDRKKYYVKLKQVNEWLPKIKDEYLRIYLSGLTLERWAKSRIHELPGPDLYEYFYEAMEHYEKAEPLRPKDDESCILHWNLCIRLMRHHTHIKPRVVTADEEHAHTYGDGFVHH